MGTADLKKAKDVVMDTGKKAIDGFNHVQTQMASVTKDQVSELEKKRENYYSLLENDENVAITKMNEYVMDIYKSYLPEMSNKYCPIVENVQKKIDNRVRFFDITKWVVDREEKDIDKLINVYQVLSQQECSIALIYKRTANECRVTMAVCNTGESDATSEADQFVERIGKSIKGNFPGAKLTESQSGSPLEISSKTEGGDTFYYSIASISNLASDKSEDFISQSMEKLLDGIVPTKSEEEYSLVLLATPCKEIDKIKADVSEKYSALSAFSQWQSNIAITEGKMLGAGANVGANAGVNFAVSGGINLARQVNNMEQIGKNEGVTRTYTNYAIKHLLDTIEKQIARYEESEALGMWNFAAYAISADPNTAEDVAHMYLSLTQGTDSYVSKSAINLWEGGNVAKDSPVATILNSVYELTHPEFAYIGDDYSHPIKKNLTTILSGKDLARALNFPHHSVAGLPVVESVSFGREVYKNEDNKEHKKQIEIGKVYHMHSSENKPVLLDVDSLCSHTFITGSTGKGKSNSVYKIIEKVCQAEENNHDFSFMVIEPAKGEYKDAFFKHPTIETKVFGTNPKETELLRLNPFVFPTGIHVLEHIDRLAEIFNACWPMYAAMPSILKNAIIKSYESCGWDMTNSENDSSMYPCFQDVLEQIKNILNSSAFSDDNKGDYTGALCTRVESLTTGLNGLIFTGDNYCTDEELFKKNVIIDLSRVGAPETKSLIMSLLVMKLQEYRMCEKIGANLALRHLTVLEEAHNILKRTSTEQSSESSNVQGKAVEVISNAIAEMRTYGEGFIIADQAPGLMDISVIRNTNTKIVLCLPEEEDRQITGRSIGLSKEQMEELSKLERGVAAVYQNDWQEAVLCKFEKYHKEYSDEQKKQDYPLDKETFKYEGQNHKIKTVSQAKIEILKYLLSKVIKNKEASDITSNENLHKDVLVCGFKAKAHRDLDFIIDSEELIDVEGITPYISYLYDSEALLDNKTARSFEEWNDQIIRRLDVGLEELDAISKNTLIQCLINEQIRLNEGFKPYAEKWNIYMKGRM